MKTELAAIITCPQCGFARHEHLPPHELAESILAREKQIAELMDEIKGLLS